MRIGKFQISRIRDKQNDTSYLEMTEAQFEALQTNGKRLVLGTLAARSGTRWLCDIVASHNRCHAVTERDVVAESFWRYIKYNELPIDSDGIVRLLKQRIADDWQQNDLTLIFSPYFSHGFVELYEALKPDRVIFGYAPPEFVVQSIYNKGVFVEDYSRQNTDLAIGYNPEFGEKWSHLFGRIVPRGDFYDTWHGLTRVGKISWWVNHINMAIYRQLEHIPNERILFFDLSYADQNYEYYQNLATELDLSPRLEKDQFLALKKLTVKKSDNVRHQWSDRENAEFEHHISEWREVYETL
jgi:hypothetical protein